MKTNHTVIETIGIFISKTALAACTFGLIALAFSGCGGSGMSLTGKSGGGGTTPGNPVGPNLTQMSRDDFTVGPGQHATEVEPHLLSNGTTFVSAFQVGRIAPGGATDVGWATSTDGGNTWSHGALPGLTTGEGSGSFSAASDPNVAYDAKHNVWMISTLPLSDVTQVAVSRSTDGGFTWQDPVIVNPALDSSDKNWLVCDSGSASPYYGNCYQEWDNPSAGDLLQMSTSSDGGLTWSAASTTVNSARGLGGQPLVQPNGTVVVPFEGISGSSGQISAYTSTNGGTSWGAPVTIATIQYHNDDGEIRSGPLPSAAIDGAGTIWVLWGDCRFRANCASNDLVYSTSSDGATWSTVTRVPIDDVSSTADYFIPGIGIDPATSGATAHVAIHYYYYSQTACSFSSCQLYVGYISSANGGTTWNSPSTLTAAAMILGSLPDSQNGLMVGDYIATAFVNGVPHGVFAVASPKSGSAFNEAIYTAQGLTAAAMGPQRSSAGDKPLHKLSDPIEREAPEKAIPPVRRSARSSPKHSAQPTAK